MTATVSDALNREWTVISNESFREYCFGSRGVVRIESPKALNVSESGGHRLIDAAGVSYYVPAGWLCIKWVASPNFVQ